MTTNLTCEYCYSIITVNNNNHEPYYVHMDSCRIIHNQFLYECEHKGCSYKTNYSNDIEIHDNTCSYKPKNK